MYSNLLWLAQEIRKEQVKEHRSSQYNTRFGSEIWLSHRCHLTNTIRLNPHSKHVPLMSVTGLNTHQSTMEIRYGFRKVTRYRGENLTTLFLRTQFEPSSMGFQKLRTTGVSTSHLMKCKRDTDIDSNAIKKKTLEKNDKTVVSNTKKIK